MDFSMMNERLSENALAHISSVHLGAAIVSIIILVYIIAWFYRNEYNPKYVVRAYAVYGIAHIVVWGFLLPLPIMVVIGLYVFGAIVLIFRSNKYFYSKHT